MCGRCSSCADPPHSTPSRAVTPHSWAPRGVAQSLPQLSAWPILLGGMKLEIMSLMPAAPFSSQAPVLPGRLWGGRGAAQVYRARLCHVPLPPPAPAEAPAAAGRGSEELLPLAPTHSQGTKRFLVKGGVLKFGAWSCSPGPGGTRAAGRTAPVSAGRTEGLGSVLALEW